MLIGGLILLSELIRSLRLIWISFLCTDPTDLGIFFKVSYCSFFAFCSGYWSIIHSHPTPNPCCSWSVMGVSADLSPPSCFYLNVMHSRYRFPCKSTMWVLSSLVSSVHSSDLYPFCFLIVFAYPGILTISCFGNCKLIRIYYNRLFILNCIVCHTISWSLDPAWLLYHCWMNVINVNVTPVLM